MMTPPNLARSGFPQKPQPAAKPFKAVANPFVENRLCCKILLLAWMPAATGLLALPRSVMSLAETAVTKYSRPPL